MRAIPGTITRLAVETWAALASSQEFLVDAEAFGFVTSRDEQPARPSS
ncbi:MAG TPA: hypothetical protein VKB35_14355 [Ktedonobacteraceae bacterium]|nr:hypothetical protein [Ktedonobacteraceae bacterium]